MGKEVPNQQFRSHRTRPWYLDTMGHQQGDERVRRNPQMRRQLEQRTKVLKKEILGNHEKPQF